MSTVHFPQMKKICAFESGTMDFSVLLWYIYNIFKGQTMTFICNIFPQDTRLKRLWNGVGVDEEIS